MKTFADYVKAHGYRAVADAVGVKYQAVQQWAVRNKPPAERCLAIEAATGISRYRLRPDVYGPEPK